MKKSYSSASPLLSIISIYLLVDVTLSEPRAQVLQFKCGAIPMHNTTVFADNFVTIMGRISDQVRNDSFATMQVGTGPDANYALAQCYGDLSLSDCVLCYAEGRGLLPACFPNNSARVYLDGCFMRVENHTFYDEISGPDDKTLCGNATRKDIRFQESARRALLEAVREAPVKGGFARPEVHVSGSMNDSAYVLANCWRTISESSCRACLSNASASVKQCLPWSEGRVLNAGCFLRYSDTEFLNAEQRGGGSKGANEGLQLEKSLKDSSLNFKYSTLQKATGFFDDKYKLGQGGFGVVYRGVLADGREVAVKRLFVNSRQRAADFCNEVNLISSVEHKNLVRLLGCSISGAESLLVYELLPNMSLDGFLFDVNRGKELNWKKRLQIITGTAEGLAYLHENKDIRIIHRDIKASNILLDSKLQAKIADFGLARTFQEDKTHISTVIAGTLGYMAPEYLAHGQVTEKADVYSFGVLVLEIITGRQNNTGKHDDFSDSLITSSWKHFHQGISEELFDPNLMLQNDDDRNNTKYDISRVMHVGLLCTQEVPALRPFMPDVLRTLSQKGEELPAPSNPPFINENTMEFNLGDSVADITHSSVYAR